MAKKQVKEVSIEEKLAKALVDGEKAPVNKELHIFKKPTKKSQKLDDGDLKRLYEFRQAIPEENLPLYRKELEKAAARSSYVDYLSYVFPSFLPTRLHRYIATIVQDVVMRVERGEVVRLCLSMPPRFGKSLSLTESLPTWFVGRNPDSMVILTAYNADLAERFGDKNRQKAKAFWKPLFDLQISPSQDNKTLFEVKGRRGGIMSVGITGGITGNGGRLIIVDDPYKNGAEAFNPTIRENIETMFRDSVLTRVEGSGNAVIVIHTRWHEDDLIGKLMKEDGWYVINLPALADYNDPIGRKLGEPLLPELGYDLEWASRTMKSVGKKVWNALYMGKPTMEGGNLFTRQSLRFYKKADLPTHFDAITQSWDLSNESKKTSDFVAGQVWGRKGGDHYLLKRIKKRMSFTESLNMIRSVSSSYPEAKRIIVEKRANGGAIIETLNKEIGGIIAYQPKDSKVQRALAITPYFEAGNIYLPDESIDPNIEDYVAELLLFPNSDHDDEVDATTQYLDEVRYQNSGKIVLESNFVKLSNAMRGIKA